MHSGIAFDSEDIMNRPRVYIDPEIVAKLFPCKGQGTLMPRLSPAAEKLLVHEYEGV